MDKKNKNGSHVGMVLSFVVFITFLIFVYTVLEPAFKDTKEQEYVIERLKESILKELYANLTSVSVFIENNDSTANCLITDVGEEVGDKVPIVKDTEDNQINSNCLSSNIRFEWPEHDKVLFKIYYSEEEFDNNLPTINTCNQTEIKSMKKEEAIFESKIERLFGDYPSLKGKFNVEGVNDFDFYFTYNNGSYIGSKGQNVSISVYVQNFPVNYLTKQANITIGSLSVVVW